MSFFSELQRRNVFRVALLYIVAGWLILQVGELLFDMLGVPDWGLRLVFGIMVLGFPIVLVFSWIYEITPEGIKREKDIEPDASITRETAKKLDIAVIVTLLLVGVMVIVQLNVERPQRETTVAGQTETDAVTEPEEEIPERSIAVLPFTDMSAAGDQEYFADGISEELLNLLARVDGLKVAARTSSFKFKDADADISEIGRALKVNTVLEGSVRKAGNRVRITAQLIDVDEGYHLWSDSFDRDLNDIFSVQDEIAGAIVDALKVELLGAHGEALASEATDTVEAYDLYLLGRHYFHQRTPESLPRAIELFEQVIERDPDFAPAWSGLADSYVLIFQYGDYDPKEATRRAREAAERAVELDPELAEAHASLGLALGAAGNVQAAVDHLRRAIDLNPGYSMAHMWLGVQLLNEGRIDAAYESFTNAAEVDPLHPIIAENIGDTLSRMGRLQEAKSHLEKAIESNPETIALQTRLADVLIDWGRLDEGYRWAVRAFETDPSSPYALQQRVRADRTLGRTEAATFWLHRLEREVPNSPFIGFETAFTLMAQRRYDELLSLAREWMAGDRMRLANFGRIMAAHALLLEGDGEAAQPLLEEVNLELIPPGARPFIKAHLAYAHLLQGQREEATAAAESGIALIDDMESEGCDENWLPFNRAFFSLVLGQREQALDLLETAYSRGWRIYYEPNLIPLMDQMIGADARYVALKGRILADIEHMRQAVEAMEAETGA